MSEGCVGDLPLAPKPSIGLPLSFWVDKMEVWRLLQSTVNPVALCLLLLFLSFLSFSQGILLTCIDLPDKGRLCAVVDYKIQLQNKYFKE